MPVLLFKLERLYESCVMLFVGGSALSRAEPPAGPPKFDLLFAGGTFPKMLVILWVQNRVANLENWNLKTDSFLQG